MFVVTVLQHSNGRDVRIVCLGSRLSLLLLCYRRSVFQEGLQGIRLHQIVSQRQGLATSQT